MAPQSIGSSSSLTETSPRFQLMPYVSLFFFFSCGLCAQRTPSTEIPISSHKTSAVCSIRPLGSCHFPNSGQKVRTPEALLIARLAAAHDAITHKTFSLTVRRCRIPLLSILLLVSACVIAWNIVVPFPCAKRFFLRPVELWKQHRAFA